MDGQADLILSCLLYKGMNLLPTGANSFHKEKDDFYIDFPCSGYTTAEVVYKAFSKNGQIAWVVRHRPNLSLADGQTYLNLSCWMHVYARRLVFSWSSWYEIIGNVQLKEKGPGTGGGLKCYIVYMLYQGYFWVKIVHEPIKFISLMDFLKIWWALGKTDGPKNAKYLL